MTWQEKCCLGDWWDEACLGVGHGALGLMSDETLYNN